MPERTNHKKITFYRHEQVQGFQKNERVLFYIFVFQKTNFSWI
jgi:hypothetical protein